MLKVLILEKPISDLIFLLTYLCVDLFPLNIFPYSLQPRCPTYRRSTGICVVEMSGLWEKKKEEGVGGGHHLGSMYLITHELLLACTHTHRIMPSRLRHCKFCPLTSANNGLIERLKVVTLSPRVYVCEHPTAGVSHTWNRLKLNVREIPEHELFNQICVRACMLVCVYMHFSLQWQCLCSCMCFLNIPL